MGRMMKTHFYTIYLEDNSEIEIEYEQEPFIPAKTYGPPEDCYPSEGGGVDIISVGIRKSDGAWIYYAATDEEIEKWTAEIEALPIEDDGPDPDEWYDRMRDERMGL
jgi:hypothetical protein